VEGPAGGPQNRWTRARQRRNRRRRQTAVTARCGARRPQIYHPVVRCCRRGWLPTVRRFDRSIGSNAMGENRKVGRTAN